MKKKESFDQAMERVEAITARLESGELSLEEAVNLYQEGVSLCVASQQRLEQAVQQVTILRRDLEGVLREEPFAKDSKDELE